MKTVHDQTIDRLLKSYPEAAHNGFMKAIRTVARKFDMEAPETLPTILPDLRFIDSECMSIVCIEVEDRNPISASKLRKYERLWWYMDCEYWELHLITADRWGSLSPIPLWEYGHFGEFSGVPLSPNSVIGVEVEKNKAVFELTQAYALADQQERKRSREAWMSKFPNLLLANFGRNSGPDVHPNPETH